MEVVFSRIGDRNILAFAHVMLAFLWSLAFVPGAQEYVQAYVPWGKVAMFLNTLERLNATRPEALQYPPLGTESMRQLPEDFIMRGLSWSEYYLPDTFFAGPIVGEDERSLEMPSHTVYRAERCLWLGLQLSSVSWLRERRISKLMERLQLDQWLDYDKESKRFTATKFAQCLQPDETDEENNRSSTMRSGSEFSTVS